MRYETPEVVMLPPAIDVIQSPKDTPGPEGPHDGSPSYEDWE